MRKSGGGVRKGEECVRETGGFFFQKRLGGKEGIGRGWGGGRGAKAQKGEKERANYQV